MSQILLNRFDIRLYEILASWPDVDNQGLVDLQPNIVMPECPRSPVDSPMDLHKKYHRMQNTLYLQFTNELKRINYIFHHSFHQQEQLYKITVDHFYNESQNYESFMERVFTTSNDFCLKITELFTEYAKRINETWTNRRNKLEVYRKVRIKHTAYRYAEASKHLARTFENDTKFSLEHSPNTPESITPKQIEENLANLAYEFPQLSFFQST